MIDVPEEALTFGFENRMTGTHTSRTIMLPELRSLLVAYPADAHLHDYRAAVIDENVLLKPTLGTRRATFRYLRDRYLLDPRTTLFGALRDLWDDDHAAQPLLAMLCAAARDPLLRATADPVLTTPVGNEVTLGKLADAMVAFAPDRYNTETMTATARRVASSWEQAGYLSGRRRKFRVRATCRPTAVAYALLLGHLCGVRGEGLFQTLWIQLLDAPRHLVQEQAVVASQAGWIEVRQAGAVTEGGFRHLLRERGDGDSRS